MLEWASVEMFWTIDIILVINISVKLQNGQTGVSFWPNWWVDG